MTNPCSLAAFDVAEGTAILRRTPAVLRTLLEGLDDGWIRANEGVGTWSPFDILGHLIHGERTDWIPRAKMILARASEPFPPFDRLAQLEESKGRTTTELLDTFDSLRAENLATLEAMRLEGPQLELEGTHPELGPVTLGQLLATWVAHDLSHIHQISRIMARRYEDCVGAWNREGYLGILRSARRGP